MGIKSALRTETHMSICTFLKGTFAAGFILVSAGWPAHAKNVCRDIQLPAERAKLSRLLTSNGFSREEARFILKGADQQINGIRQSRLSPAGKECGLAAVRALVLGCLNHTLPSTLRSTASPDRKTGKALWGKPDVTRREAAVIGMAHVCKASAMERFLSR